MGFHIKLGKTLKLYVRNPFKLVKINSPRYIEDVDEFNDVYGTPTVTSGCTQQIVDMSESVPTKG